MADPIRILFVDDDPDLRDVWSTILKSEGFEVHVAATVTDALVLITKEKFNVLIADLNVGNPGDGFTVVSAMRRVQPNAVTFILTGYPAFQAALRAIHDQVDDFLIKPAEPETVISRIRENLGRTKRASAVLTQRLPQVISQNRESIINQWYQTVECDPELKKVQMSRAERIDHLPDVLDELVRPQISGFGVEAATRSSAAQHGKFRREQGYTPSMLLEETRILHRVIANCLQQNLLAVDISMVLPDMLDMGDKLHLLSKSSLQAFLNPAPAKGTA
jgi:DNA-binding response OmpR family regulator